MATNQERVLKAEHDARVARTESAINAANVDYIAMMSDIEIPIEEEAENESEI